MRIETFKCDQCERDLTCTDKPPHYGPNWRFEVRMDQIPGPPSDKWTTYVTPGVLYGLRHFCGIECLSKWAGQANTKYGKKDTA